MGPVNSTITDAIAGLHSAAWPGRPGVVEHSPCLHRQPHLVRLIYAVRVDGPNRHHYRLFCVLERGGADLGLGGPSLVLVAGKDKPFQTKLSEAEYGEILSLVREFQKRDPRSVLT